MAHTDIEAQTGDSNTSSPVKRIFSRIVDIFYFEEPSLYKACRSPETYELLKQSTGLYSRAAALQSSYETNSEVFDLEHALSLYDELDTLHRYEESIIYLPSLRARGRALHDLYQLSKDMTFLEKAIITYERVYDASHGQETPDALLNDLNNLLAVYTLRYDAQAGVNDLEEIIKLYRTSLRLRQPNPGATRRIRDQDALVCALIKHYEVNEQPADLEEISEVCRQGLDEVSDKSQQRFVFLQHLGLALATLYTHTKDTQYLDQAIDTYEIALTQCGHGHPNRAHFLHNLSVALVNRHRLSRDERTLTNAIGCLDEALGLRPAGDPEGDRDRFSTLVAYGIALYTLFDAGGSQSNLKRTVEVLREAHNLCDVDHKDRATVTVYLARSLDAIYRQSNELSILEEVIDLFEEALRLPAGEEERAVILSHIGNVRIERYEHARAVGMLGNNEDLNQAINCYSEALKSSPSDENDKPSLLGDAAFALSRRYHIQGDPEDLKESLLYFCEALKLCRKDRADHWRLLHNFAVTLKLDRVGADTAKLVDLHREALELHQKIHRTVPPILINHLAVNLRRLHEQTTRMEPLNEAVQLHESALQLCPFGSRDRARTLHLLALALSARFNLSRNPEDLNEAIRAFSRATSDPHHRAAARYSYAIDWIKFSKSESLKDITSSAYEAAILLLPQMACFDLDIASRLHPLSESAGIACDAADHALKLSEIGKALQLLEQGRTTFWSQALRLRTRFDDLPKDLHRRLSEITRELESGSYHSAAISFASSIAMNNQDAEGRRKLADEFESLMREIRAMPGFGNFLHPEPFSHLRNAAADGPVVILIPGASHCHGVIIRPSSKQAQQVGLPDVDVKILLAWRKALDGLNKPSRSRLGDHGDIVEIRKGHIVIEGIDRDRDSRLRYCSILDELWRKIAQPILRCLGYKASETPTSAKRPRLWWCLTGPFVFLPIHAAGSYGFGPSDECLSDYVVSSYTPTLSALINARKNIEARPPRALLIAEPSVPGRRTLPETVHEVEIIQEILPEGSLLSLIEGGARKSINVTVQGVLDRISLASIVHFACHGSQHRGNPLESGFILRNGKLSVADLMKVKMPHAFFAFLSACESASGDLTLPDETVHLAATMMFSGFRSVVGTMWSMDDRDGPLVAKAVYKALFNEDGMHNTDFSSIPLALDGAVRKLRSEGAHPSRWATWVHMGV